jgi:hypothetical protein
MLKTAEHMLQLPTVPLAAPALAQLEGWQGGVDGKLTYVEQVAEAKAKFKQRNKGPNKTFQAVKIALTAMCSGARRCIYCEDSVADEVEHMAPKDLYPQKVFAWDNYVYACGSCNGPKNNHFGVIDANGALIDVTRKPKAPIVPPVPGSPALINPRVEDALAFFDLDLLGTFVLDVKPGLPAAVRTRATYTRDVLDLNRDVLLKARRNAYGSFRARLVEYRVNRDGGGAATQLSAMRTGFEEMPHPTVFAEMKRLHTRIPDLKAIFASVPEALAWGPY